MGTGPTHVQNLSHTCPNLFHTCPTSVQTCPTPAQICPIPESRDAVSDLRSHHLKLTLNKGEILCQGSLDLNLIITKISVLTKTRMYNFRADPSVSLEPGEDGADSPVLEAQWLEAVSAPVVAEPLLNREPQRMG